MTGTFATQFVSGSPEVDRRTQGREGFLQGLLVKGDCSEKRKCELDSFSFLTARLEREEGAKRGENSV